MTHDTAKLFSTVPKKDYLNLMDQDEPRYKDVVTFLGLRAKEIAEATGVPVASVRFDAKMPSELADRVREWVVLINLVAGFFDGNREKTFLWFTVPNPLLGGMAPRQMIRFGRFRKLFRLVTQAIDENRKP